MRIVNVSLALASLVAVSVNHLPAASAQQNSPPLEVYQGEQGGQALVEGQVLAESGRPLADQDVTLYLWPSQDAMENLQEGDSVKMQPVSRARTDRNGNFQIRLRSVDDLAVGRSRYDLVNFDVVASTAENTYTYSFGGRVRGSGASGVVTQPEARGDSAPLRARAEFARTKNHGTGAQAPQAKSCTSQLRTDYGTRVSIVGQTNSTSPNINHDFIYAAGSASSLGIGVSASGNSGTYSRSGTNTIGANALVDFAFAQGVTNKRYHTYFRVGKFYVSCVDPWTGIGSYRYETRAFGWAGGTHYTTTGLPSTPYCVPFNYGDRFEKTNSRAYRYENGFEVGSLIGINLEATTGYDNYGKSLFAFYGITYLCGGADYPAGPGTTHLTGTPRV